MRKLGYLATPYLVLVGSAALPFAVVAACGDDDATTDAGTVPRDSGGGTMDSGGGSMDAGGGDMDAGGGGMDAGEMPMGEDFNLSLTMYDPHVGNDYEVAVLDGDMVVGSTSGMLAMAAETITIPGVIEDGITYTVHWYMDLNMNGSCDPPDMDHSWERMGMGDMGLTIEHAHDAVWVDVCSSF